MARFKKFKAPKIATVIGTGTEIDGDITFSGGLHVDGYIRGAVRGGQSEQSALTLSEQGTVEGDLQVPNIIINGTVVGDVYASQRVELAPKAKVTGSVYYNLLEMAMGAEVNGQLIHNKEAEPQMLSYKGEGDTADTEESEDAGPELDEVDSERAPRGR